MAKRIRIKYKRQGVPFKDKKLRVLFLGPDGLINNALVAMIGTCDGLDAYCLTTTDKPDIVVGAISKKIRLKQSGEFVVVIDSITKYELKMISAIEQKYPLAKIIFLTSGIGTGLARRVMMSGAVGIVLKSQTAGELIGAIKTVAGGGFYLDSLTLNAVDSIERFRNNAFKGKKLSALQIQVVTFIGDGKSIAEMMRDTGKNSGGVKNARHSALEKLGLLTNADLVKYAIRTGLCSLE